MLINLIDKNCAKIVLFLAVSPGSNYRRNEIKDKTKLNNVPLDISLNKLIVLDIIKEKNKPIATFKKNDAVFLSVLITCGLAGNFLNQRFF